MLFFNLHAVTSSPFTVLPCAIEFPKVVKTIPQICVYQGGEKFTCEIDQEGKRTCFTLPIDKTSTNFFLLIAEGLEYESEENTVQYLKVDSKTPYKFYRMELVRAPKKRYRTPSEKNKKQEEKDRWIIAETKLEESGRIPDDAIIVLLNANYVKEVKGDNGFELPSIIIREDVLSVAGSETELHDQSIELLLSSIDYNPLHSSFKVHTKQDQQKILVAMAGM